MHCISFASFVHLAVKKFRESTVGRIINRKVRKVRKEIFKNRI